MKKTFCFIILILGLLINVNVDANEIKKISMDIYIDKYGNARITEVWQANLTEGTEGYKPYYNFGNASITNFSVSMGGREFTRLNAWDINGGFNDKAYKSGINYLSDGLELCFGISKYGNNTYTMKYDINGFVTTLNDADMIYWTLIPHELSSAPDSVYIKIYSDFKYDNQWDIWGYGYEEGYAYFADGYIEMSTNGPLNSNEYMVALVKFPKETFNTNNIINDDFENYLNMAEEGAEKYIPENNNDYNNDYSSNFPWSIFSVIMIFPWIIIGWAIGYAIKHGNAIGTKKLKFPDGKKIGKDINYFRDIPCDKDIFKAYWVARNYYMIRQKTDFLGALLLKWLKEDRIQSTTVISKFLKKEEQAIRFINNTNMSGIEYDIYNMMQEASIDDVLEPSEFKKWCEKNHSKVLKWFDKIADETTDKFVQEGKIAKEGKAYFVNSAMKEEAIKMKGLKNYLNHFSNIKEREAMEVKLWDYYLIYAQIFGIAKKVAKEFKKLYPEMIPEEYYSNMVFIHTFAYTGMNAANSAHSRAQSYSGGGGGFSSGGGGGGSFGGGGGGGGFR